MLTIWAARKPINLFSPFSYLYGFEDKKNSWQWKCEKERNVFEMLCWVAILQKSAVRLMAKNVLNSISSFLRLFSIFTIQFSSVFCMYISGLIFLLSWLFLSNKTVSFFYLLFLFSVLLCVVSVICTLLIFYSLFFILASSSSFSFLVFVCFVSLLIQC